MFSSSSSRCSSCQEFTLIRSLLAAFPNFPSV
ncbi:MAG: hypothetical protein FJ011_19430 [Chloroflexi bacterium]|nr:hypothetical protein [Chloroflexota bacterium]